MDGDHSGTITVEELKDAMKRQGSPVAQDELNTLVASLDVDNSGEAVHFIHYRGGIPILQSSEALNTIMLPACCNGIAVSCGFE